LKRKSEWLPPVLFLSALVFAFGLLIPRLGFYWDDWPPILIGKFQGTQAYWEFYKYDRPFSAWTFVGLFPILGTKPIAWQIFTLVVRWLTTVFVWLSLRELWPAERKQATWAAILFALSPSFDQQAISVAFSQHWVCYLFYLASVWGMIKAVRTNNLTYAILSYALAGIQLLTMEYFAGLEFLRPLILLVSVSETEQSWRKRLGFTLKIWWPYLLILAAYSYWRMFLVEFPEGDPNQIVIFARIAENPVTAVSQLFEASFQDTVNTLFGVWNKTITGRSLELDSPFFRRVIMVSFFSAITTWFTLSHLQREVTNLQSESTKKWGYQAMAIGVIALALGALPAWVAGRESTASFFSSRFSLASIFGASLFLTGLLEWVTPRVFVKITLLSVMVAITTNYHLRIIDQYRLSWDLQKKFFWELYWRASSIAPNTPLISDNEVLLYAGGYATAMGINLLYSQDADPESLPYWFFSLDDKLDGQINRFNEGDNLQGTLRNLSFSGDSSDSLIINNDGRRCLHVLADGRAENALLPAPLQRVAFVSNLDRIQTQPDSSLPDPNIFGPEPEHTWCYYYEKAELARQFEDWEQISLLGDQALSAGFAPIDPLEWFVFIEGYGLSGQVEQAMSFTQDVFNTRDDYAPALCTLWMDMTSRQDVKQLLLDEWNTLQESLSCVLE